VSLALQAAIMRLIFWLSVPPKNVFCAGRVDKVIEAATGLICHHTRLQSHVLLENRRKTWYNEMAKSRKAGACKC